MIGAFTHLRLYGSRVVALRELRDFEPAATIGDEGERSRALARAAGLEEAAPFFTGPHRRDLADAALAALGRDRDLCFRILFQSGLGLLFAVGLASAGASLTTNLAIFAGFLALPTWALAVGGPTAIVELLLAAPLGGRAARDLLHARLLTVLALLLGADVEPTIARRVAESLAGAKLPEPVLGAALTGRGFAAGKIVLRPEAEDALLRGAARLTRAAQLRFRLLILGVAAIGLAALFAGGVTTLRDQGLLPSLGGRPAGEPTQLPFDPEREREGSFVAPTAITSSTNGNGR